MKKGMMLIGMLVLAGGTFAQEPALATEAVVKAQEIDMLKMLLQGGWAMIPLGILSFMMVTFVIQNMISLREKRLLHLEMMPDLVEMMIGKKVKTALIYCRRHPSMFTNIFSAGLDRVLDDVKDFAKVDESVKEASVEQVASLMKPIDTLSIIGATAPMLGLLGTVSGMIKAFQTMGTQGMGKPELLAANIGEALITTATGLVIAIPAMFFYFYFKKKFNKVLATLGRNVGYLFDALETGKQPTSFLDLEALERMDGE